MNINSLILIAGAVYGLVLTSPALRAQEAPVIVNPQTGATVELTRAYWDANADIADRVMQCDFFAYDAASAVFIKKPENESLYPYPPEGPHEQTRSYFHFPLPDFPPHINFAHMGDDTTDTTSVRGYRPYWGVVDGVYAGVAPLAKSEFVEIVSYRSGNNDAVRVWYEDTETPNYHVCYALDGRALLPTGAAGNLVNYVSLPDFTFETPAEIDLDEGIPEFINLETGEPVKLVRGEWSYNQNVALHRFECSNFTWGDGATFYVGAGDGGNSSRIFFPYSGGDTIKVYYQRDAAPWFNGTLSVNQFSFASGPMELTDSGYRVWQSNGFYTECVVAKLKPANGNAYDYIPDEHLYWVNGEGPITPIRELPLSTIDCDYTDADSYDGFGWNSVTNESCPPLEDTTSDPQLVTGSNEDSTGSGIEEGSTDESSGTGDADGTGQTGTTTDNSLDSQTVTDENGNDAQIDSGEPVANTGGSGGGSLSFRGLILVFVLALPRRREMVT